MIGLAEESFGFASVYRESMVLQMSPYQAILWGYGTPGAIVNVSLVQDVYTTKVQEGPDSRGIWRIVLKPQPAGGPHTFQGVHDDHGLLNWVLLKNVLFGEVWICSGQSNMQFTVSMVSYSFAVSHFPVLCLIFCKSLAMILICLQ